MPPPSLVIPGDLHQDVYHWSKQNVQGFLEANKDRRHLDVKHIQNLKEKKVTGEVLVELTKAELKTSYGLTPGAATIVSIIVEQLNVVKGLRTAKKRPHEEISKEEGSNEEQSDEDNDHAKRRKLDAAQASIVERTYNAPPPSCTARDPAFLREQRKHPHILNGRGVNNNDNVGLPVCLYNEAFAHFEEVMRNPELKLTDKEYTCTQNFLYSAGELYEVEQDRVDAITPHLQKLIDTVLYNGPNINRAHCNKAVQTQCEGGRMAFRMIMEVKNEIGTGGSDPAIQGACTYKSYWSDTTAVPLRNSCCCPTFIIAFAGCSMQILGAVFVEKVIVQPLTDYIWLGNGTYQEDRLFTITKVFRALSEGMRILDSYYKGLQFADEGVIDRSFPYPRCYPAGSNQHGSTDFHYVSQLVEGNPHRAIFKGRMADSKQEIVVKFVEKYNVSAHRLLASHGLAPKLLHPLDGDPLKIGRLQMIVMEFVRGQNAYYVQLSNDMLNEVERAINILHDGGWVFGDLRTPNIMLRDRKPLLIDFDWCAKDNVGTYPRSLNKEIQWHKDVERGGIMKKEHDIFMLKQLHQGFSLS